jgi:membrane-bound lytic murein transglycosylase F
MYKYLILLIVLSFGCSKQKKRIQLTGWDDVVKKGEITFLTMNTSSSYFQGKEGEYEGFEYELAKAFAKDQGLKFKFKTVEDVDSILDQLEYNYGHIGVAGITNTKIRKLKFDFSPSYNSVYQTVVCRKRFKIKKSSELAKLNLIVSSQTSYEETLNFLKTKDSKLTWESRKGVNSETLLQEVWSSKNKCTITDSHLVDLHRRYLPELVKVYQFQNKNELSWAFLKGDKKTKKILRKWFSKKGTQNLIADLKRKYFEFIEFDSYNLKVFNKRIKSRLPKYKKLFKEAALKQNLPWEFVAAVGYQESFWNPKAVSPTGVRGVMMLTRRTAKELGVKNRLDPKQSIFGGAKYLRKLINRMPSYLNEDDKLWFALASYNVGYYHLRDAMALSIWRNKDPTRWHTVETVLPLLSERKHYRRLMYGHARGLEPVIYVNRIKDFYDILRKKTNPNKLGAKKKVEPISAKKKSD